ncbi:hypothetical protein SAMN04488101_10186 [Pedobacter nyackensis]|uniref:Uncharacterized protein n=1 Tax=Pedobacter nyackensis TaxID=475255 RepID=A0A1W1ZVM5_9SPHI|nr:hypothetical protein SAMN04488101_10186 [Pedobacter nyackensis]
MSPVSESDKAKINYLYSQIKNINVPDFNERETVDLSVKVRDGLQIILKAIKEVSTVINK